MGLVSSCWGWLGCPAEGEAQAIVLACFGGVLATDSVVSSFSETPAGPGGEHLLCLRQEETKKTRDVVSRRVGGRG